MLLTCKSSIGVIILLHRKPICTQPPSPAFPIKYIISANALALHEVQVIVLPPPLWHTQSIATPHPTPSPKANIVSSSKTFSSSSRSRNLRTLSAYLIF